MGPAQYVRVVKWMCMVWFIQSGFWDIKFLDGLSSSKSETCKNILPSCREYKNIVDYRKGLEMWSMVLSQRKTISF